MDVDTTEQLQLLFCIPVVHLTSDSILERLVSQRGVSGGCESIHPKLPASDLHEFQLNFISSKSLIYSLYSTVLGQNYHKTTALGTNYNRHELNDASPQRQHNGPG